MYPSAENNYTFYLGPSELGAHLIDKASWCLVTMCRFMFCTLESSRNAFTQGAWVDVQRIVKRSLLLSRKKKALNNIGKSFFIIWQSCAHSWQTLQTPYESLRNVAMHFQPFKCVERCISKCMGLYEYPHKDMAYVAPFYHFNFTFFILIFCLNYFGMAHKHSQTMRKTF